MAPLRVGIIGARRHSQGIGEYVAREFAACGAEVAAVMGTRPETLSAACDNLRNRYGLDARGYLSVPQMLDSEHLDAIAICSPHRFHREQLELALARRLHTLCEKPLLFEEGRDLAAEARRLADGFANIRRRLMVNAQWPYTLPAYDRCWPGVRRPGKAPERVAMMLCPAESGLSMIPNMLPHVLSLLLSVAPRGGEASAVQIESSATTLDLRFDYRHALGVTRVAARFRQCLQPPRPAGYALDGFGVRRLIHPPDYRMSLEPIRFEDVGDFWRFMEHGPGNAASETPLEDPLALLVRAFLRGLPPGDVDDGPATAVADGVRLLEDVLRAALD